MTGPRESDERTWVPGKPEKGVRVTVLADNGEGETTVMDDDYVITCAGSCYVAHVQTFANGTHILTIKGRCAS